MLHEGAERHGAAVRPGPLAVAHVEHMPILRLVGGILSYHIRTGQPREFIRTGSELVGQQQGIMAIGMAVIEIPLVQERQPRQEHQPDDGAKRGAEKTLRGVHWVGSGRSQPVQAV